MNEPPIEAQVVPENEALVVRKPVGGVGILRPADTLDAIAEAFKQYQAVCERILTKDDYQEYEGKPRKKKSAWRKLATAFNVSTEVVEKEIERDDKRNVLSAFFTIRAMVGTRQTNGSGYCEITEKCCPGRAGAQCRKAAWKGHSCCENGCDGRKHWSHANHDIISTAETRAKNRAIADLIGCGEVSAEELTDDAGPKPPPAPREPAAPPAAQKPTPGPKLKPPTQATRVWMLKELEKEGLYTLAQEYFTKLENPAPLMPNEALGDLRLIFVPNTKAELAMLITRIKDFGNGDHANPPYPWHWDAEDKPPQTVSQVAAQVAQAAQGKNPLWWRDVIVPIPRAGMKASEYVGQEDTLGSLFDLRHGNDEEAQKARQRLWGLLEYRSDPDNLTNKDGKKREPTDVDREFAKALVAFKQYFEDNHRGEKL